MCYWEGLFETFLILINRNPLNMCKSFNFRADLAKILKTSERQVRKAIDALRDKKIRRKGSDSGEWEIIG